MPFVAAWLLVVASAALLWLRLPTLPELIPGWRGPSGVVLVPASALMVLRIPAMGAVTLALAQAAHGGSRSAGWRTLFTAGALAAALKAAFESAELASLGTSWEPARPLLLAATVATVAAFVLTTVTMWRQGRLDPADVELRRGDRAGLVVGLAAWAALASAPAWAGG